MAALLGTFYKFYNYIFNESQDPLTKNLLLLGSPIPIAILVVVYIYGVQSWGPKQMASRPPFDLSRIMMIYNIFQVLANLYLTIEGLICLLDPNVSFICEPISNVDTPTRRRFVTATYFYFLIKITDLLDTVFFVMRKKNNQVSFLHVYHHACVLIVTYGYAKFLSGSHGFLFGVLNSFVHTVMYGYYFTTIFKPELKNSFWWKKHITQLQLIQFVILFVYFSIPLFVKGCTIPPGLLFIPIIQNVFMFVLFSDFYIKAYLKKPNPKKG